MANVPIEILWKTGNLSDQTTDAIAGILLTTRATLFAGDTTAQDIQRLLRSARYSIHFVMELESGTPPSKLIRMFPTQADDQTGAVQVQVRSPREPDVMRHFIFIVKENLSLDEQLGPLPSASPSEDKASKRLRGPDPDPRAREASSGKMAHEKSL